MAYDDLDIVEPLDRLFEDHLKEFESGKIRGRIRGRNSDRELIRMARELGDYENGSLTGRQNNW